MSDRILLACGLAVMIAALLGFIAWRVWYHAPDKVRLRRYRKERASDIAALESRSSGTGS